MRSATRFLHLCILGLAATAFSGGACASDLPATVHVTFDRSTTYVSGRAVNVSISARNEDGSVAAGAESALVILRVIVRSQIGRVDGESAQAAGIGDGTAIRGGTAGQDGIYALKAHARTDTLVQSVLNSNHYESAGPGSDMTGSLPSEAALPLTNGIGACSVVYPSVGGIDTLTFTLQAIRTSGQTRTVTTIDQANHTIVVSERGGTPLALRLTSITTPATEANAGALVLAYGHFGGSHTAGTVATSWDAVASIGAGQEESTLPLDRTVLTAGSGGHVVTIRTIGGTFSGPVTLTLTPAPNSWIRHAAPMAATRTDEGLVDPTGSAFFNNDPSASAPVTFTATMTDGLATITIPASGGPTAAGRWWLQASAVRTDGETVTSPARRDFITVFPAQPAALRAEIDRAAFARVDYSGRATIHPGTPRLILAIVDAYGNLADPARIDYAGSTLECIVTWLGAVTGSGNYAIPAGLNRAVLPLCENFSGAAAGGVARFTATVSPTESATYTASNTVTATVRILPLCGEVLGPNTRPGTRYSDHLDAKTDGNPDPNSLKIGIDKYGANGHPDKWDAYGTVGATTVYPITHALPGTAATTDPNLTPQNVTLHIYNAHHTRIDTLTVEAGAYQDTDGAIEGAGVCAVPWRRPFNGDAYAIVEDPLNVHGSFLLPLNDTGLELSLRMEYGYTTSDFQGSMGATNGINITVNTGSPAALALHERGGGALVDADGTFLGTQHAFLPGSGAYVSVLQLGHYSSGVGNVNSVNLSIGGAGDGSVAAREEYFAMADAMGNQLSGEAAVGRLTVTSALSADVAYDSGSVYAADAADAAFGSTGDFAWMVPGVASSHAVQIRWRSEHVGKTETLTVQSNRAELAGRPLTLRFTVPDTRRELGAITAALSTATLQAGEEAVLEIRGVSADGSAVDTTVAGGQPIFLGEPPQGMSLYANTRGMLGDSPLASGAWVGADPDTHDGIRLLTVRAAGTAGTYTIGIGAPGGPQTSVAVTIVSSGGTDPIDPGDTGATQALLAPFYATEGGFVTTLGLCNTGSEQARVALLADNGVRSADFHLAGGEGVVVDLAARGLAGTGGYRVLYSGTNATPSLVAESWTAAQGLVLRVPVMSPRTTAVFGSTYLYDNGVDTYIAVFSTAATRETGVIRFGAVPQYLTVNPGETVLRTAGQLGATAGMNVFSIEGFSSYAAAAWVVTAGGLAAPVGLESASAMYLAAPLSLHDGSVSTLLAIGSAGDQETLLTVNGALQTTSLMPRSSRLLDTRALPGGTYGTVEILATSPVVADTWLLIGPQALWLPTRAPQPGAAGCYWRVHAAEGVNTYFVCHNAGTASAGPVITFRGSGTGTVAVGALGIGEMRIIDVGATGIAGEGTWTAAHALGVTIHACVITPTGIWSVSAQ